MDRLKSRKLWVTIAAGALVAFGEQFGIVLDDATVLSLVGLVAAYVGGQAVVDRGQVVAEVQSQTPVLVKALNDALQRIAVLEEQDTEDPLSEPYL